jgi:hypothetical protein
MKALVLSQEQHLSLFRTMFATPNLTQTFADAVPNDAVEFEPSVVLANMDAYARERAAAGVLAAATPPKG